MVQNNKVLTVSYGTFSCTLEGFEDSFGTMKAIAEYFRDLASDDRYFGAEPPQPDAEMLARIAEREIARQVEARREGGGFVLRASGGTAGSGLIEGPRAAAQPPAQPFVEPAAETVAAPAAETVAETPPVAEPVTEPAARKDAPRAEGPAPRISAAAAAAKAAITATATPRPEGTPAPRGSVPADSIAAKLQRIRAVVSKQRGEVYSEDQHADPLLQPKADAPDDADPRGAVPMDDMTEADQAAGFDADPAEDDAALERALAMLEADEDDLLLDTVDADLAPSDDTGTQTQEDPLSDDEDRDHDSPAKAVSKDEDEDEIDLPEDRPSRAEVRAARREARLLKVKRSDLEAAQAEGALEEIAEDGKEDAAAPAAAEAPPAPQVKAEAQEKPAARPAIASSLSDEDEADLMRELQAVEKEIEADRAMRAAAAEALAKARRDLEAASPAAAATPAAAAEQPKPRRRAKDTQDHDDVSRLMEAAGRKLDEQDVATNRDTYTQLRAAVAAANAERSAGGTVGHYPDDDPYRADLANAVRPRRPVTSLLPEQSSQMRPATPRPAPLKLVAAQRIDAPSGTGGSATHGTVRPRRVTTQLLEEATPIKGLEGGFAEYADEMGAKSLPELLEAAASYLSFVEGREQFTRPQLMHQVRQLEAQEFNREDGLRHFGKLLRDGKIEKTGGGQFTASGQIGFRPEARAAG